MFMVPNPFSDTIQPTFLMFMVPNSYANPIKRARVNGWLNMPAHVHIHVRAHCMLVYVSVSSHILHYTGAGWKTIVDLNCS